MNVDDNTHNNAYFQDGEASIHGPTKTGGTPPIAETRLPTDDQIIQTGGIVPTTGEISRITTGGISRETEGEDGNSRTRGDPHPLDSHHETEIGVSTRL